MILGIGINCDDEGIDGHLDRLAPQLEQAVAAGFDSYELSAEACNIIRGGRIDQPELDQVKAILARYPLRYTVHPPCSLRLTEPSGLHRQVFLSCLEVSGQIGASVMVYHSAQIALLPTDRDVAPLPGAEALHQLWQVETAALLEMAPEAQKRGVIIAVENRDPHLWEVAALARHGKSANDLVTYHQGMRLDLLARQAAELDSPSIGICLDVGHAFLAAPYWPQPDFLAAVRQVAPFVRHVHFHDNFGRLDAEAVSLRERLVFGEADNHAPPGWGTIPLAEALSILRQADYSGWITVELRSRYMSLMPEVATSMHALITKGRSISA